MSGQDLAARFGKLVASRRRAARMTQEELAAKASVHRTYVGDIENGRKSPTLDTANRLARALGETLSELMLSCERVAES